MGFNFATGQMEEDTQTPKPSDTSAAPTDTFNFATGGFGNDIPVDNTPPPKSTFDKYIDFSNAIGDKAAEGINKLYDIAGGIVAPGISHEELRNQVGADTVIGLPAAAIDVGQKILTHPIDSSVSAVGGAARGVSDFITNAIINLTPTSVTGVDRDSLKSAVSDTLDKYLSPDVIKNDAIAQGFHTAGETAPLVAAGGILGEQAGLSQVVDKAGFTGTNVARARLLASLGEGAGFVAGGQTQLPLDAHIEERAKQAATDLAGLGLFKLGSAAFEAAKSKIAGEMNPQYAAITVPEKGGGFKAPTEDLAKIAEQVKAQATPEEAPVATPIETSVAEMPEVSGQGDPTKLSFNTLVKGDVSGKKLPVSMNEANKSLIDAGYSKSEAGDIIASLADKTTKILGKTALYTSDVKEAAFQYSTPSTSLQTEATKYKSAEEFVKAQGASTYHGTKSPITDISQSDVWQYGDEGALFGQGTYLTDSPDIAKSYSLNKGKGIDGKVLEATLKPDVKLFNLENKLDNNTAEYFNKTIESVYNNFSLSGKLDKVNGMTGKDAFRLLKEYLASAEIPKYEAGDYIDSIQQALKQDGYAGFSHIGGIKGGAKHNVSIIFPNEQGLFPKEILNQTKSQLTDIWNKANGVIPAPEATPSVAEPAAPEATPSVAEPAAPEATPSITEPAAPVEQAQTKSTAPERDVAIKQPVETGNEKVESKSVTIDNMKQHLTPEEFDKFKDDTSHQRAARVEQASNAASFVKDNPEVTDKIIFGDENPPKGLRHQDILTEARIKALDDYKAGKIPFDKYMDYIKADELYGSKSGSELGARRGRFAADDPAEWLQKARQTVEDSKIKFEGRKVTSKEKGATINKEVAKISKARVKLLDYDKIIDTLTC